MTEYTRQDAENSICRSLHEFHEASHEAPSIKACTEEPCGNISPEGLDLIDSAKQFHWGRG